MLKFEGEVIVADKFDMANEDSVGKTYFIKVEEQGLSKSLIVDKEIWDLLPTSTELKVRSMTDDQVKVQISGALKTDKMGWKPMIAQVNMVGLPARNRRATSEAA